MHRALAPIILAVAVGCGGDDDDHDHDHDHDATLDAASSPDALPPDAAPWRDAPSGALPDLQLMAERMIETWYVEQQIFAPEDCAIVEECVDFAGERTLLRFDTVTNNAGEGHLHIGVPEAG